MFGNNVPMKPQQQVPNLLVREVFATIQGEGPFTGRPAVFVRLGGCNLRCKFCDTDFDVDKSVVQSPEATADWIAETAREQWGRCEHAIVVVTGGEPLLQNLGNLFEALDPYRFAAIQVETSGSVAPPPGYQDWSVTTVVSPKTPKVDRETAMLAGCYKYVIRDRDPVDEGGIPYYQAIQADAKPMDVARPPAWVTVWLQPVEAYHGDGTVDREATQSNERWATQVAIDFGHCLSLQVHKHAGLP